MAYITRTGDVLLNPSEKGLKYAFELKHKRAVTNDFKRKIDPKTGLTKRLTKEQLAYRAGYLEHQKDSNRAFMSSHKSYKRKTKSCKL